MRRLLFLCGVLLAPLVAACPAFGQGGTVSIYADTHGSIPYLYDDGPQIIDCYVVHTSAQYATACSFSAPLPECFQGSYMADEAVFPVTLGNSQTGVAVGYGTCCTRPVHVLTIKLFGSGLTQGGCEWKVLPSPLSEIGAVESVDCAFNLVPAEGGTVIFNPDERHCEQPVLSLNGYETVSFDGRAWAVQVDVHNSGAAEASDVSVTMHEDIPWLILPDPQCYYGTIAAGDSSLGGSDAYVFDLTLYPGGGFNAWFDVSYRDTCNMLHTLRLDPEFDPEAEVALENSPSAGALSDRMLGQNYPNPFNPVTTIPVNLSEAMNVRLSIFDSRGALVRTLADDRMPAGLSEFVWDGRDADGSAVSSGMYFCRLTTGTSIETRKLVLLK